MELLKINAFPPWIKIHGYNIGRTYGSVQQNFDLMKVYQENDNRLMFRRP